MIMRGRWRRALALLVCAWWNQARVCGQGGPTHAETLESMVDGHMESLDRRAAAHWAQGRPDKAVTLYEEMAAYRPRHADSHFNVGIAQYALGEHAKCMQALDRALRLPSGVPHHSMYHQQMAACACKLGEKKNDHILWDQCIRHLTQAIYVDPQNGVAWATAATNYMALGFEQTATRASDAAARLPHLGADALAALGVNYARVGRYAAAIRLFQRALATDPRLHRTRVELLHAKSAVADWRGYAASMACVCMCVCMCVYVCVYVCMCACMYACMYVCVYVCVYVCMYVCGMPPLLGGLVLVCMYVCLCVYEPPAFRRTARPSFPLSIHPSIHPSTYVYTHTHTHLLFGALLGPVFLVPPGVPCLMRRLQLRL